MVILLLVLLVLYCFNNSISSSSNAVIRTMMMKQQYYRRQLVQLRGRGNKKTQQQRDMYNYHLQHRREHERILLNRHHDWSVLHTPRDREREPKVFYSIFAGREFPLRIQFEYLQELLNQRLVDEIHIWDYTCYSYNPNGYKDAKFLLNTLWQMDDRIYYVRSQTCGWTEYYQFYQRYPLHPRDVLIKADDDIVFIDTSRFAGFIRTMRQYNNEVFMWSANIINNGMAAAFQELDGVLPKQPNGTVTTDTNSTTTSYARMMDIEPHCPGDVLSLCFSLNGTRGKEVHQEFLTNPTKFTTPIPGKEIRLMKGRISINFIAWLGQNYPRVLKHLGDHPWGDYVGGNDEVALTLGATHDDEEQNAMYMPLVVAHGSFGTQGLWEENYAFQLYKDAMPRLKNITSKWKLPPGNKKLPFPTVANV